MKHNGFVRETRRVSSRAMKFIDGGFTVALSVFDDFWRGQQIDDAFFLGCPMYCFFSLDLQAKQRVLVVSLHACQLGQGAIFSHHNVNDIMVLPDFVIDFR